MSRTRTLVEQLRRRMGSASPMSAPPPVCVVTPPPARVFPRRVEPTRHAAKAAQHTTALVGIGHVGTRYATDVVLQFQAELAVAHEAVSSELSEDFAADHDLLPVFSRARDHREYLLRPDLGRRLSVESAARLRSEARHGADVQIIVADGLSALACMTSGVQVMAALAGECEQRGMTVGTPVCARYARVWLEDDIGEAVGARVAVIILGERPGLGTGDGLSAYMVHRPRVGNTDSDRNMISNIHLRGTPPEVAARRLAAMASAMLEQGKSGVELDLSGLGEVDPSGYRAAHVRERLVERS